MNEEIKGLAQIARDQTDKGTLFEIGLAEYTENLSLLIIKECLEVLQQMPYKESSDSYQAAIKNHFGVNK